jgi:outer membrane protein OmpA-like peptidoglycan-associated protein
VQALDSNVGDPAAEQKAKAYLTDVTDIAKLGDDQLRKRLDDVRELLAANDLSQETERAVRARLLKEREVLRLRVAQAEAAKQQQAATQAAAPPPLVAQPAGKPGVAPAPSAPAPKGTGGGLNFNLSIGVITGLTPPRQVLEDRRPPDQLQVQELQRRIQVYGEAQGDRQYDPAYRDYWRQSLNYDREMLRERMKQERRRRAEELAMAASQNQIEVNIDPYAQADRQRLPRSVFAAEVSDMDMQDVLTAPPPRFDRRFKVKDIANTPDIRNALPRVEVDTVHFGYNEGFIREEELGNLDGVATTIERIVKKYPNEVFLIEGHTDAVGSDVYNLKLSKLRAESVKRALTTYYVIPAKSLRTVGLGERFLKIPTSDPEPENRRVSVLRITPLLGQGQ